VVSVSFQKSRSKSRNKHGEVKVIFTFKSKYFGENFDDELKKLLAKAFEKNVPEFLKREFEFVEAL